jgi:uncharacterized membrane protein
MHYLLPIHLIAAVVWVGGMFFAWMVLRPVAAAVLEPPLRLTVWNQSFQRFFVWVWLAVILLPVTGYWMMFSTYGSMANTPVYIHIMNATGLLMMALYLFLYFLPYQRLQEAVVTSQWPEGGIQLITIRKIVGTNLILGLLTILIAGAGRYF